MPMFDVWTAWDWELNDTVDEIFDDKQAAITWCDKQNAGIDIDEGEPGFSPHILSLWVSNDMLVRALRSWATFEMNEYVLCTKCQASHHEDEQHTCKQEEE